ncbi:MAG: proline--tRNA ligase [Acidobacteria bacterium]|nr:MAG: proline--tRNA ligase [Acidobacteriota bacterium]
MRRSNYLLNTLKETPKEAAIVSHQYMLRTGMIKQLAAGIYSYMPLALRSLKKVEQIIREELEHAGAIELLMPAVQPADLWIESGRWKNYGKELLRVVDRKNNEFCIGPTHEEVITDLVRKEVRSYKDLPLNLFQIQTKFRDEIRPRFGLMRGREFIMKDAYSFDKDVDGAVQSYWKMHEAYSRIFQRCGLKFRPVEADSGNIGGSVTHEFHVLAQSGEDAILSCSSCEYAANIERAEVRIPQPLQSERSVADPVEVATPGQKKIEEVAAFLDAKPADCIKALAYRYEDQFALVFIRGDRDLNEVALRNAMDVPALDLVSEEDFQTLDIARGMVPGYIGPMDFPENWTVLVDHEVLAMEKAIVGANKLDTHMTGFVPSVHLDQKNVQVESLRQAVEGETCARCGQGQLELFRGIEVGHIFMLGTKYSEAMKATYLDENGKEQFTVMGCYGIGVGRTMAAAIEQNHDENGIIWPVQIAPFHVALLNLDVKDDLVNQTCETLYHELKSMGVDVLYDDRHQRPGFKFKDADLIGMPFQLVIGSKSLAKGKVDFKDRRKGEKIPIAAAEAVEFVLKELREAGWSQ